MSKESSEHSLSERVTHIEDRQVKTESDVERLMTAFPDSDPSAHRLYHMSIIESVINSKKRWQEVLTFSLKSLIWAAIASIGTIIWPHVKLIFLGHV